MLEDTCSSLGIRLGKSRDTGFVPSRLRLSMLRRRCEWICLLWEGALSRFLCVRTGYTHLGFVIEVGDQLCGMSRPLSLSMLQTYLTVRALIFRKRPPPQFVANMVRFVSFAPTGVLSALTTVRCSLLRYLGVSVLQISCCLSLSVFLFCCAPAIWIADKTLLWLLQLVADPSQINRDTVAHMYCHVDTGVPYVSYNTRRIER
jgi:hypothetical protein